MEVKIFATCAGLEKIYPGKREVSFNDIRTMSKSGIIGNNCYSLSLKDNGIQISKLIDVVDTHSYRSGFLRIMLELKYTEVNQGQRVLDLLTQIHTLFKDKYLEDNRVNISWFYDNIHLLEERISQNLFRETESNIGSTIQRVRANRNAHIYYKSTDDLIGYFNLPKQQEYLNYDTIYFIIESERPKDFNPMHTFLNYDEVGGNDLTNVVELDNLEYQLIGNNEINYIIKVDNGTGEIEKRTGDYIRWKDSISITFKKRYYKDDTIKGKLSDGSLNNYLITDRNDKTVKIIQSLNLKENVEVLQFQFKNSATDKPISDLNFIARNPRSHREIPLSKIKNEFNFFGEEWGQEWTLELKKENRGNSTFEIESGTRKIIPEQEKSPVLINLIESRLFTFKFVYNDKPVENVTMAFKDESIKIENSKVILVGKQLYNNHRYKLCCEGYEEMSDKFRPYEVSTDIIKIELKKAEPKSSTEPIYSWLKISSVTFLVFLVIGLFYKLLPMVLDEKAPPKKPPVQIPPISDTNKHPVKEQEIKSEDNKKPINNQGTSPVAPRKTNVSPTPTKSSTVIVDEKPMSGSDEGIKKEVASSPTKDDFNDIIKKVNNQEDLNALISKINALPKGSLKKQLNLNLNKINQNWNEFKLLESNKRASYLIN